MRFPRNPADCARCNKTRADVLAENRREAKVLLDVSLGAWADPTPMETHINHRMRHHIAWMEDLFREKHPVRARARRILGRKPGRVEVELYSPSRAAS